jgi:hypothetical protein
MGSYGTGIALAVLAIGGILLGMSLLDLYFYEHNSPSVGWRIQRWARTKHVLSGALLLIFMMLVTHFVFNPIGT